MNFSNRHRRRRSLLLLFAAVCVADCADPAPASDGIAMSEASKRNTASQYAVCKTTRVRSRAGVRTHRCAERIDLRKYLREV